MKESLKNLMLLSTGKGAAAGFISRYFKRNILRKENQTENSLYENQRLLKNMKKKDHCLKTLNFEVRTKK